MPKTVIFAGSTISKEEILKILPDAIVYPPARCGDLMSVVQQEKAEIIGLLDGVFDQSLSVWHKEILYALSNGVKVLGASSMGAIRAAECEAFGMIPIGLIATKYMMGHFENDDIVALVFDENYKKSTEPLVNIFATLRRAAITGFITQEEMYSMNSKASTLHYTERTFQKIGLDSRVVKLCYSDVKKADALLLLHKIAEGEFPENPKFKLEQSSHFLALFERDRWVERPFGRVPLCFIEGSATVHSKVRDEIRRSSDNRAATLKLAEVLNINPTSDEIKTETMEFLEKSGVKNDSDLCGWLKESDMTGVQFLDLMKEQAAIRRVHATIRTTNVYRGSTRNFLNHLRLTGQYAYYADLAAQEEALKPDYESEESIQSLSKKHGMESDEKIIAFIEHHGYDTPSEMRIDLIRALASES